MNFSSINFDKFSKIVSFPASRVIWNKDALLMNVILYRYIGFLPRVENLKIHKHSLKYKSLGEDFNNYSSEVGTRVGIGGL